jgi:REP element-mobilizing transposase RayT
MPNHVHWLVQPLAGHALESILRTVKQFVSSRIAGRQGGRAWQADSYDRIVRNVAELRAWRRYIEENPRRAGLPAGKPVVYHADWLDEP